MLELIKKESHREEKRKSGTDKRDNEEKVKEMRDIITEKEKSN